MMLLKVQPTVLYKKFLEVSYKYKSKKEGWLRY
jgi:hypothetical protein